MLFVVFLVIRIMYSVLYVDVYCRGILYMFKKYLLNKWIKEWSGLIEVVIKKLIKEKRIKKVLNIEFWGLFIVKLLEVLVK